MPTTVVPSSGLELITYDTGLPDADLGVKALPKKALSDSEVQEIYARYKSDLARLRDTAFPTVHHRFPDLAESNGGGGKVLMDFLSSMYAISMDAHVEITTFLEGRTGIPGATTR